MTNLFLRNLRKQVLEPLISIAHLLKYGNILIISFDTLSAVKTRKTTKLLEIEILNDEKKSV